MSEKALEQGSNQDEYIRKSILGYLKTTYSEEIEGLLNDKTFKNLKKIFDGQEDVTSRKVSGGISSTREANEIRGQVSRYLESYPDNPGLLFSRGLSEVFCTDPDSDLVLQNINAAIKFAIERYSINKQYLYRVLCWIVSRVYSRSEAMYEALVLDLLNNIKDEDFEEALVSSPELTLNMLYVPFLYSMNRKAKKAVNILNS